MFRHLVCIGSGTTKQAHTCRNICQGPRGGDLRFGPSCGHIAVQGDCDDVNMFMSLKACRNPLVEPKERKHPSIPSSNHLQSLVPQCLVLLEHLREVDVRKAIQEGFHATHLDPTDP